MNSQKGFVTLASLILSALTGLGGIGAVIFLNGNAFRGILNAQLAVSKNEEASEHAAVLGFTIPDVTPTPTGTLEVTPTPTPSTTVTPTPTPGFGEDEDDREKDDDDKDTEEINEHAGLNVQSQIEVQTHGHNGSHGDHD